MAAKKDATVVTGREAERRVTVVVGGTPRCLALGFASRSTEAIDELADGAHAGLAAAEAR
jgi:hypothetical protein